jgi:hypothetical protein
MNSRSALAASTILAFVPSGQQAFLPRTGHYMKTLLESPEVNTFSTAKSIGLALILFVIVYAPAFALVALLRPNFRIAITLIIIVSAELAALIMVLLARSGQRNPRVRCCHIFAWLGRGLAPCFLGAA